MGARIVQPHIDAGGACDPVADSVWERVPVTVPLELQPSALALSKAIDALDGQGHHPFLEPHRLDDAGWVANRWCELLSLPLEVKQRMMVLDNPLLRLELVGDMLERSGITG